MSLWLLDTNIASHIIRGDQPDILRRLITVPMADIAVSAVTEAELRYGLARRGHPPKLTARVGEFLLRVEVLPWSQDVPAVYGELRAVCEKAGVSLAPLDMMIAAHAMAADAVLVTRDRAFARVPGLATEDWA